MAKPVEVAFGKRVREKRNKLGWSLRKLSEESGLTIAFLSDLENGRRGIGLGNAVDLAECLGEKFSRMIRRPYNYGKCPHCEGAAIEKEVSGNAICINGHRFPAKAIVPFK